MTPPAISTTQDVVDVLKNAREYNQTESSQPVTCQEIRIFLNQQGHNTQLPEEVRQKLLNAAKSIPSSSENYLKNSNASQATLQLQSELGS